MILDKLKAYGWMAAALQGTLSVLQYRIETLERNLAQATNAPVTQRPR